MSDIVQGPTTPRRSTARNGGSRLAPTQPAEPGDIFGESPSKKGSASVKYGGKKRVGGGGTGNSSPSRAPDSRRGNLSTRLGLTNDTGESGPTSAQTSPRKNGTGKGSRKAAKVPSSPPASISASMATTPKRRSNLKRSRAEAEMPKTSDEDDDGFGSELSDLTTPPSSPPKRTRQQPPSSKISIISISTGSPPSSPRKPASKLPQSKPKSILKKPARKPLSKSASWAPSTSKATNGDAASWSLNTLGTHVVVLLNAGAPSARVRVYGADGEEEDEDDGKQWCWWPAKATHKTTPEDELVITPYLLPKTKKLHLRAVNASSSNIRPLTTSGHVRFETLTFSSPSLLSTTFVLKSPKKKRKVDKSPSLTDLEELYGRALAQALDDHQEKDFDGLPPLSIALSRAASFSAANGPSSTSAAKGKGKGKRRSTALKESISGDELTEPEYVESGDDESEWEEVEDPGADIFLDIPGETVLCRAKKSTMTEYWPAQVLGYVPPPARRKKGKGKNRGAVEGMYRVVFLDNKEMEVPRSWFYSVNQEEFGRCKMGVFESEFVDNPNDDSDEEDSYSDYDFEGEFEYISQQLPPTSDETDFYSHPLPIQFAHTIPVLQAIINDTYPPTRERHEAFIKGGKSRSTLNTEDSVGLRGRMNPKDVACFGKLVQAWSLGTSSGQLKETNGLPADQTGNTVDDPSETANVSSQVPTDNTPMVVDPTGPAEAATTAAAADDADTRMDAPDEASFKENISPHPSSTGVGVEPKVVPEVTMVDIQIDEPDASAVPTASQTRPSSPPTSSYPPSSSGATPRPSLDLDANEIPGMAPPLPLLTTGSEDIMKPPVMEAGEESPLTPIVETQVAAPPAAFEARSERPRKKREPQRGCESYEKLAGIERVTYSSTILLPIVIRQVLLWRAGDRVAPGQLQVLSDEEEWELHKKGEELAKEVDWVFDVRRLRDAVEKRIRREGSDKGEGERAKRARRRG
ncbi:hypothetical protein AAF712_005892 [Marasmius tenuissimus]|uniref:Uncharacterized protein n=1 Tax=Marasmius tenuissimus TaxID=585030 RepID=A0ABR3A0J9_9AGAR